MPHLFNFSLFISGWIENGWGTWVELLSLSVIAFQTNRQSQLKWRPLFLNALHKSPDILTDQRRLVAGQRRQVHFETNLGIVKRDAFESTVYGAFRACWRQPRQDVIVSKQCHGMFFLAHRMANPDWLAVCSDSLQNQVVHMVMDVPIEEYPGVRTKLVQLYGGFP